jgi:hypothetical protein
VLLKFETLGQYHDHWAWTLGYAPDRFRDVRTIGLAADQHGALQEAFQQIRSGFPFVARKLKDQRLTRVAAELIEMSLEAYLAGDSKTGAHALQECEGLIWPGRRQKVKYAIEAEKRAFGENVLYAGIVPSPFPYEGTAADLGPDQATLLALATRWSRAWQATGKDFRYMSWAIDMDGVIRRISAEPKEDAHPVLEPAQRSWGFKRLKELGENGGIRACVLMAIIAPQGDGLVSYDLEERGLPRVSGRQLFRQQPGGIQYEPMAFHLEDPQILPLQSVQA